MGKINDGGPAFPVEDIVVRKEGKLHGAPVSSAGMSLRDWFAGRAMQAALVNASASNEEVLGELFQTIAELSYMAADAMLAARKAGEQ